MNYVFFNIVTLFISQYSEVVGWLFLCEEKKVETDKATVNY